MYSEPATPVRSVSEHRLEDKNVQPKQRANSCPDEKNPIIVESIKPGKREA